jgi:C-terminal processing protease CtpA/Prc
MQERTNSENLLAQIASLEALERRASNGGTAFEEISLPEGCVEVVISRMKMETRLGMKLRSGGVQLQPFIDELDPDGLAAHSGLAVGDIICWINGEKAVGANQVAKILTTSLKLRLIVRKDGNAEALRQITGGK